MNANITNSLAKEADGTIQITFNIPWSIVKDSEEHVVEELAREMEIPGFRKGNAPVSKAKELIKRESVIQKVVAHLLPKALGEAFTQEKIRPAIYPRLEVVAAEEEKPWQVRAVTCEIPLIDLGDYRGAIKGASIIKSSKETPKPKEEKQQEVLKVLLSTVKLEIPKILINEEVDSRLASLLERIEKLGLTLESYLASIGKSPQTLREDYVKQADESIKLDLILDKIAEEDKITVKETEIDDVIAASSADSSLQKKLDTPEQRRLIASVLKRRASLDSLTALV